MSEAGDNEESNQLLANRFRTFLPVVVDIETGGFNSATDAMLEIAAVILGMDESGVIGIDPFHPLRIARPEREVMQTLFGIVRDALKASHCKRAILVGHNAHFDLGFVNAASERHNLKRNPFHPFSCFDTATLSGLAYGQTVLARACETAGIDFDNDEAHSARYDAEKTAELYCQIVNKWQQLGGWPLS